MSPDEIAEFLRLKSQLNSLSYSDMRRYQTLLGKLISERPQGTTLADLIKNSGRK